MWMNRPHICHETYKTAKLIKKSSRNEIIVIMVYQQKLLTYVILKGKLFWSIKNNVGHIYIILIGFLFSPTPSHQRGWNKSFCACTLPLPVFPVHARLRSWLTLTPTGSHPVIRRIKAQGSKQVSCAVPTLLIVKERHCFSGPLS
ncbi:hypothetical protein [Klebsiella phage ST13-OXA48phi12.2]|nr:hypothetical protein [Klebsiella phage ST13-OXA48phi12.2]